MAGRGLKLLLDTHTFLWWDASPEKLSQVAHDVLADPKNALTLSVVSVWEMQIKSQLGKLTLRTQLDTVVREQRKRNGVTLLPLRLNHIYALKNLPQHHKDPFDRLLIAQAETENMTLVSKDAALRAYGVKTIW